MINTHYYDNNISSELLFKVRNYPLFNKTEKIESLKQLIIDPLSLKYFNEIIQKNEGNYDTINNLDCLDLLCIISDHINQDVLVMLNEQLLDMKTGFCPQGRTIRFLQIIFSFM